MFFQRASVTLSQFSGLISREWQSKAFFLCDLRLLIEKLKNCMNPQRKTFEGTCVDELLDNLLAQEIEMKT